jgi:hypothetical protein
MKRRRLNRLSLGERAELNRQLKDVVEAFARAKVNSAHRSCSYERLMARCESIDYRGLNKITR